MSEQDFEDTFEPIAEEEPVAEEVTEEPKQEAVAAEEVAEEVTEEVETPKKEPQTVPLATLIKQRDEFKGEISELRQKLEQVVKQPEPEPRPDPLEDPEGAAAYDANTLHMRDLNRSQRMAEREHGKDFVQEAFQAAQAAGLAAQFGQSQFGWEDMAEWHKTNVEAEEAKTLATEIGDPVAYKEKVKAEVLAELKAEQVAKTITSPSLADETSIGGRKPPAAPVHTPLDELL